jgi:hypothetical protein
MSAWIIVLVILPLTNPRAPENFGAKNNSIFQHLVKKLVINFVRKLEL